MVQQIEQYDRFYELTVAKQSGEAEIFRDQQISFSVEKTSRSAANKAEITITNLNKSSRDFIDTKNLNIALVAGYKLDNKLIVSGRTDKVNHTKESTDWKSKVEVKDGIQFLNNRRVNKSFDSGVTLDQLIREVASQMSVPIGSIKDIPTIVFNSGRVITGNAKQELDSLTQPYDLKWNITDGSLYVAGVNKAIGNQIILLNKKSGLLGTPERIDGGWKFKSWLRPGSNPGDYVKVESRTVTGQLLIKKLNHKGTFRNSNEWFTEFESGEAV